MTPSRSFSLLATALLSVCSYAAAQTQPALKPRVDPPAESLWPKYSVYEGERVVVVATAHPLDRQFCKVKSIDEHEIVCSKSHGKTVSFQKEDVAALIRPGEKENRWPTFVASGVISTIGAAIFYSALCVASISTPLIAVAVPVALVGAILGVDGLVLPFLLIGDKGTGESVLYRQPGEVLQLTLHS